MKRPRPQPPSNAPAGTVWFGGPIGWFRISIQIRAEDLAPEAITALFNVEPDQAEKKGVPLLRSDGSVQRIPKFGRWVIELTQKETDEWDVEEAAWSLLRRLPSDIEVWRAIPAPATIRLSFALSLESANQGFALEPEFVRYVAERNIGLDFDIYRENEEGA